jgi:hypothetical protein
VYAALAGSLVLGAAGLAFAQGKVITIEALKVEGKIQKPEAFYILQRSELGFKSITPKKSFIPKILKTVEKEPF